MTRPTLHGRQDRIRAKIAAGELPSTPPESTRTGFAQSGLGLEHATPDRSSDNGDALCSACDTPIKPVQLAYELEYADRRIWRMHHGCHRLWLRELVRAQPPSQRRPRLA